MNGLELDTNDLKQIEYNDLMIQNSLSKEQQEAIDYKAIQRIKMNRINAKNTAMKKYKKSIKMFTLSDRTRILESELTEEMIESEIAKGFEGYYK